GTELAINGSMELDSDWTNISGAPPTTNAQSSAVVDSGSFSRHVVASAANQGIEGDPWNMSAGKTYLVAARVYAASGAVKMQVTGQTDFDRVSTGAAQWNTLLATYTASADATGKKLQFIANGGAADFYVDAVSITEVDPNAALSTDFAFQLGGA